MSDIHDYAPIHEGEYLAGSVWEYNRSPYKGAIVTVLGRHALQGLLRVSMKYMPTSTQEGKPIEVKMVQPPARLDPLSAVRMLALLAGDAQ